MSMMKRNKRWNKEMIKWTMKTNVEQTPGEYYIMNNLSGKNIIRPNMDIKQVTQETLCTLERK